MHNQPLTSVSEMIGIVGTGNCLNTVWSWSDWGQVNDLGSDTEGRQNAVCRESPLSSATI